MDQHLKRVLNLVRRTGDTMVVVDKDSDDAFVVMDLDRYEQIIDESSFNEEHDFDENCKDCQDLEPISAKDADPRIWDVMQPADGEGQTWNLDQLSQEELNDLEKNYQEFVARNDLKKQSEPPLDHSGKIEGEQTQKQDKDFGDEQFYLEPIE